LKLVWYEKEVITKSDEPFGWGNRKFKLKITYVYNTDKLRRDGL